MWSSSGADAIGNGAGAISNAMTGLSGAVAATIDATLWQWGITLGGVSRVFDMSEAVNGDTLENSYSALDSHDAGLTHPMGIGGVKSWIRTLLIWLAYIGLLLYFAEELRQGLVETMTVNSFQINPNAGGEVNQLMIGAPAVTIRNVMLVGLGAIVLTLPALCVALLTSLLATIGTDIPGAVSVISGGGGIFTGPSVVYQIWTLINKVLPIFEWSVMGGNILFGQLLIDTAVSVLVLKVKAYGL